ncbi:MAG: DEAD/DEAH box helicase [Acidimicrobiales bacterium]|nr:DEAD/DEAH box helicase [Acidimicrobiales bacterium]MDG1878530.1 DEAD/DEAH box helicase [Acidimicrobiales bacterium]
MNRSITLRQWQHEALRAFLDHPRANFLAVACPGAGKTTFALTAARHWLRGERLPLVVVAPTRHLKTQWASAAERFGFHLEPEWDASLGDIPSDMHGIVVTYAQVASAARTLFTVSRGGIVILDEVHHAGGDLSWGEGVAEAFAEANSRLLLSGTPFRSDDAPIPFVDYTLGDHGDAVSDYEYDYGNALVDGGVVRPVFFPRFDGHMEWIGADGALKEASFSDDLAREDRSARLRTALDADGQWLPTVLVKADEKLRQLRKQQPDAGGLVIAIDQDHARACAALLERWTGEAPALALSDDPRASEVIDGYARSDQAWVVAVRMISEGVDIPRLRVGVHATTTVTPLFFRQAVGRIARWTPGLASQKAYFYVPDDPRLRHHAQNIAAQRRHSINERIENQAQRETALNDLTRAVQVDEQPSLFQALSSTALGGEETSPPADDGINPHEDIVIAAEELAGLPVDLPPPPKLPGRDFDVKGALGDLRTKHARKKDLRQWNADRVLELVRATGMEHPMINAELNKRVGIERVGEADEPALRRRLQAADDWLNSMRQKR